MTKSDISLYITLPWLDLNLKVSFQGGTEKRQACMWVSSLPDVNIASHLFLDRLEFRGGGSRSMKWERCPLAWMCTRCTVFRVDWKLVFLRMFVSWLDYNNSLWIQTCVFAHTYSIRVECRSNWDEVFTVQTWSCFKFIDNK